MGSCPHSFGLDLKVIGRFDDHEGFSGVILGQPGSGMHFEFTYGVNRQIGAKPTVEDLIVFYIPSTSEWQSPCRAMLVARFVEVAANQVGGNPCRLQCGQVPRCTALTSWIASTAWKTLVASIWTVSRGIASSDRSMQPSTVSLMALNRVAFSGSVG